MTGRVIIMGFEGVVSQIERQWWLKVGILKPEDLGSNSDTSFYKLMTLGELLTSLCLYFTLNMGQLWFLRHSFDIRSK